MNDPASAIIAVSFFGAVAITVRSVAGLFARRSDAARARPSENAIEGRLERIENAVDVIAIEVERIAESQRFAARLAAGRDAGQVLGSTPRTADGRAITPH